MPRMLNVRNVLAAATIIASAWPAYGQQVVAAPAVSPPATAPAAAQPTMATEPATTAQAAPPASAPLSIAPQFPPPDQSATAPSDLNSPPTTLGKVVVSSDLDKTREYIAPSLGATSYTMGLDQIRTVPSGENSTLQQVLLRAPGVVEDSYGQEHVRGEHANLTYRVNGVLLPEPLNGFGQELDTRLINSVTLITGSLPAQFGFHTAGIVDVTTKSGASLKSSEISVYGGTNDTIQSSFQTGGVVDRLDYFVTGSTNHNDLGIENPVATHRSIHDYTDQYKLFLYLSYHIDDSSRVSLMLNASHADFQIPDVPGLAPQFALAGTPTANSSQVNENQNEQEYYSVVAYQKNFERLSLQWSGFVRYGQINFTPDTSRDLVFQGVAGGVINSFVTYGTQFDAAYALNDQHTLRGGFLADYTYEKLNTDTFVFALDPITQMPLSDMPENIVDNTGNHATESGIYLQDEWRLTSQLTFNYGLRYDRFDSNFDNEDQISPRANLVWTIDDATTAHFGYARYFVPPPVQDVRLATLNKFTNTTNAPPNFADGAPKVERSNYYDAGLSRQVTKAWQVNIDGFYKQAENLIDLGQFGNAVILSPYNYHAGTVYGAELSNTYKQGGFSAFANLSWVVTSAHGIISQQFEFDPDELAYIESHNIKLDHEAEYTASAGVSYAWTNDLVYLDFLYGYGLRSGFANLQKEPQYYPVSVGYEHTFRLGNASRNNVKLRFDVINVFDESYQIRSGAGLGVEAPQYGERRSFFVGLSYDF